MAPLISDLQPRPALIDRIDLPDHVAKMTGRTGRSVRQCEIAGRESESVRVDRLEDGFQGLGDDPDAGQTLEIARQAALLRPMDQMRPFGILARIAVGWVYRVPWWFEQSFFIGDLQPMKPAPAPEARRQDVELPFARPIQRRFIVSHRSLPILDALAPHRPPAIRTRVGGTTFTNNYTAINIYLALAAWMTQEWGDDRQRREIDSMTLDRFIPLTAAALMLAVPAAGQTAPPGPKVHTSKSKDITDCSAQTQGGPRKAAGLGLGALVGKNLTGSAMGIRVGSSAAGAVGEALDRTARCGPKADIESNAAADEAPKKKKKFSLSGLLGQ